MMKNRTDSFQITAPEIVIPETVHIPQAIELATKGFSKIYTIAAPEYEVVRFSFVFKAGSAWQKVAFSASATVNCLSEGTAGMSAAQISERLDYFGSYFDVSIDRDWSVVTFVCLAKFFDQTCEIAREIVLYPTFPNNEIATYRQKSRQNLTINRQRVDFQAREYFAAALYGSSHPYGCSSDESMYDSLTADDLREFFARRYTADNCFVVMSGQVTDGRRQVLENILSEMPVSSAETQPSFPEPDTTHERYVPIDGALQSAIRVGRVMFPRSHPDYIGMQVLTTVLGGYFGSRLVRNLREERGYTYGAYSAMVNFDRSGYLAVATEVGMQFTGDAVNQIFIEIEKLKTEPVPAEELDLVRNIMVGEVMRILDGPFGIADATIENIQNGTDNFYIDHFVSSIRSITPEQLGELARRYLHRDQFAAVVVGAGKNG